MIIFSRRCTVILLLFIVPVIGYTSELNMFKYVQDKAAALAKHKYLPVESKLPQFKKPLGYSKYTLEIHNNTRNDLWAKENLPFRAEPMLPGYMYTNPDKPVFLYEVYNSKIHRIPFSADYYNFGNFNDLKDIARKFPKNSGFAGVRLLSRFKNALWLFGDKEVNNSSQTLTNEPKKGILKFWEGFKKLFEGFTRNTTMVNAKRIMLKNLRDSPFHEFAVFMGASYFRAIGENCDYGLSARGIAINCTVPGKKEEFPDFREFWLIRPKPCDKDLTIYALLDGPSVTGAYQFIMRPGKITKTKVKSVLYFRKKVGVIGLCPMTSLFWFGENTKQYFPYDFRPEVHDADGLLMRGDGNQEWFPMVNYPNTEMVEKEFHFNKIKLFGLLQRDRNYEHYLCIPGCSKNAVPNLWVTPDNDWGSGNVRLTILPTDTEWIDNVNVSWKPDILPQIGKPYYFTYTLNWSLETPPSKSGCAKNTYIGVNPNDPSHPYLAVVSFDGDKLKSLLPSADLEANVSCSNNCSILGVTLVKVPYNKIWQVNIALNPKKFPVDLSCYLSRNGKKITEIWKYFWRARCVRRKSFRNKESRVSVPSKK